jgi:hypothetical protein
MAKPWNKTYAALRKSWSWMHELQFLFLEISNFSSNFSSLDQSNMPSRNCFGILALLSRAPAPDASRACCGAPRVSPRHPCHAVSWPTDVVASPKLPDTHRFTPHSYPLHERRRYAPASWHRPCPGVPRTCPSLAPSPCCVLSKPPKPLRRSPFA